MMNINEFIHFTEIRFAFVNRIFFCSKENVNDEIIVKGVYTVLLSNTTRTTIEGEITQLE